jgi:hypothetical protein
MVRRLACSVRNEATDAEDCGERLVPVLLRTEYRQCGSKIADPDTALVRK